MENSELFWTSIGVALFIVLATFVVPYQRQQKEDDWLSFFSWIWFIFIVAGIGWFVYRYVPMINDYLDSDKGVEIPIEELSREMIDYKGDKVVLRSFFHEELDDLILKERAKIEAVDRIGKERFLKLRPFFQDAALVLEMRLRRQEFNGSSYYSDVFGWYLPYEDLKVWGGDFVYEHFKMSYPKGHPSMNAYEKRYFYKEIVKAIKDYKNKKSNQRVKIN